MATPIRNPQLVIEEAKQLRKQMILAENIIKGSAKKKLTTVPRTGTYTVINNRIVKAANKIAPSVSLCIFRNFTLLMKD